MLALTLAISADLVLRLMGYANRWLFNGRFRTATLFYLADRRYLDSVTFPWYAKHRQWRPVLGGAFTFAGSGGFICVVGCNEEDFAHPANAERVMTMYKRMERIAKLLQVDTASYAGVLPSTLASMGVQRDPIEAYRTVQWLLRAIDQVRLQCGLPVSADIVVLGSQGHIGRRLTDVLRSRDGQKPVELDARREDHDQVTATLHARQPMIFVNAARGDALDDYLHVIPRGSVVLNEVYPECSSATLDKLRLANIRYFHLCGVEASSIPSFPRAYAGAVPCCAASAVASSLSSEGQRGTVVLRESIKP